MRAWSIPVILVTLSGLAGAGCGGDAQSPGAGEPDGGPIADGRDADGTNDGAAGDDRDGGGDLADEPSGRAPLRISARMVEACGSWAPDHQAGVEHQTPQQLRAGVLSVALMRSHRDPQPAELALPAPIVELDLAAGGTLLETVTGALPAGTYTHLRLGLAHSSYRVQATAHAGFDVAGAVEIDMALGAHVGVDGLPRSQGQYTATFSAYGQSQTFSGQTPINCMLSAWGGIAETANGRFEVRVPIPGGPLVIDPASDAPVEIELTFPMADAFGWRDLDQPGFIDGVFDLAMPPAASELPDALLECGLFMADRCDADVVVPLAPAWPMPDSAVVFFTDGERVLDACPAVGSPGFGQDACYAINPPAFERDGPLVHDRVTGLTWQAAASERDLDWWEARDHCAGLELAGFDDWRLPSRIELVSLLDYSRVDPTIDPQAFPDTPPAFFWSASPVPFSNLAFGVRFELGFIYDHDPYGSGRVRCVRPTPPALGQRFTYDADVVEDAGTGLTWQRRSFDGPLTWLDALAACETLELDGHADWRLPTLKETQTLVDDRRMQPSIDIDAFPDTPPEWFWSSTPIQWPPDQAWATSYTDGYASIHEFAELHRVRCVRDP